MNKYIVLLLLVVVGCASVPQSVNELTSFTIEVIEEGKSYDYDVQLSKEGFEVEEITLPRGEELMIYIADDLEGHYLTIDGNRIAERELVEESTVFVFAKGSYQITDETSKQVLTVNVE